MNRKNVTFIINSLGIGGAEKVFIEDANALADQGYGVSFVMVYGTQAENHRQSALKIPDQRTKFLKARGLLDLNAYRELRKFLRDNKTDVVYATLHDATFMARFVAMTLPGVRLVTREANTTENKSRWHKLADILMNFRVAKIVAVSRSVKESLLSYQKWLGKKIVVIHNGVTLPPEIARSEGPKKVILAVGSLTKKKAHADLIEAFSRIFGDHPEAELRIFGKGVLEENLRKLIKEKGLDGQALLNGSVAYEDLRREYAYASVFVLPSRQEGCPNVLLEAMSYGLPPVATSVGAVPEIIEDKVSGFIVPVGDPAGLAGAIAELLDSAELRKRMGEAARKKMAAEFSFAKHLDGLKAVLGL